MNNCDKNVLGIISGYSDKKLFIKKFLSLYLEMIPSRFLSQLFIVKCISKQPLYSVYMYFIKDLKKIEEKGKCKIAVQFSICKHAELRLLRSFSVPSTLDANVHVATSAFTEVCLILVLKIKLHSRLWG